MFSSVDSLDTTHDEDELNLISSDDEAPLSALKIPPPASQPMEAGGDEIEVNMVLFEEPPSQTYCV